MQCPQCLSENLADAVFCSECGKRVDVACPACGAAQAPGNKFCRRCGQAILADASRAPAAVRDGSAPQRRSDAAALVTPASSFVSGRYQVQRLLGEGSRKRVYVAHDRRLDRDVAFALIKTDGLDKAG